MGKTTAIKFKKPDQKKKRLLEKILASPADAHSLRSLLQILVEEGSLDEAERLYYLFSKRNHKEQEAGQLLARALAVKGDVSRAIKVYKDLIKRFPEGYSNYKELEKLYLRIGRPEKAITLYKRIGRKHPLRQKSYKRLTGIYWRVGDAPQAIGYLKREIEEYGLAPRRCKELGKLYLSQKRYVEAIQSFQNTLAQDREDRSLRIWLGKALLENGNYELAEYEFAELLKEHPSDFRALIHMVELRIRENRLEDAKSLLSETAGHYPDNSRLKLCHAEIGFLEGKYKEAAELAEEALRETPLYYIWEQVRCHRVLKHIYRALHDPKKSKLHEEMQDALKNSRDIFSALMGVADLKVRNGKSLEGKKILEYILDLYPDSAHARITLAEVHLAQKEVRKAIDIAEEVTRDTPPAYTMEISRAHAVLAKAYQRLSEKGKADYHKRQRVALRARGKGH